MNNKIKIFLSRLSVNKSYYIKMLIFYISFTVSILFISFSVTVNLYDKSLTQEIKESNKRLLTQVQISIDKNLFEKITEIINENFLDYTKNSKAYDFFNYNPVKSPITSLSLFNYLTNYVNNYEFIESIGIYRKNGNILISSDSGIKIDALSAENKAKISSFYYKTLNKNNNSDLMRYWVAPQNNKGYFQSSPIISYVQSIPLFTPLKSSDGCIIININHNILLNYVNKIYSGENGELILLDPAGNLFAGSNEGRLFSKGILGNNLKEILNNDTGFIVSTLENKQTGIAWQKSAYNNWKYVSLVPVKSLNKNADAIKQIIFIVLGFTLLFSIIILSIMTFKLYNPLNKIFNDMNKTIEDNLEVIKYKALIDVLYGNKNNEADIRKQLRISDDINNCNTHHLLIADIDIKAFMQLSFEEKEYITAKAVELINSFFYPSGYCISICHPFNNIVSLISNSGESSIKTNGLKELLDLLESSLKIRFNLFLSDDYKDFSSLSDVYKSMKSSLKYYFIYNYNNVFTEEDIRRYEENTPDTLNSSILQMEEALKTDKTDQFKSIFYKVVTDIKLVGYSYDYSQDFLLQTISVISRICREKQITTEKLQKHSIMTGFNSISSLDECTDWVNSIVNIYSENVLIRNNSIDKAFTDKILRFISENIEEQLSLNSIADEFNLSPSYLSRIFKENFNISFSDYISNVRLEKAAEMIVSQSDRNISDIAQRLGYFTPAYFSKIFKEKYGMTPVLYRKKYISEK